MTSEHHNVRQMESESISEGKRHLGEVVDRLLESTHDDLIQEGQGLIAQFQVIAELGVRGQAWG